MALARELIKKPNVLLLDEPTNHMDIEGITWLENFLSAVRFAVVTITHDRLFLQRVSNRIIEINPRHEGGLLNVQGDYMKYIEIRDQLILSQEKREVILKTLSAEKQLGLRQESKHVQPNKKARIQQAGTLKTQVENLTQRNIDQTARLAFVGAEKLPKRLIEVSHLSKKYKDHTIFENLTLTIGPGSRIGLIGKNGAGKSTLIRTLLSTEKASAGKVFHADQLQVAYFDQNREDLDLEQTLSNAICPDGDHVQYNGNMIHVRSYLDRFLFTKQQYDMKVGTLSGGEQSRLLVARLMLQPANLLILDEPTNDLDIATLNVLEQCLQDFPGAIILVSHDRYFLDQISNQLLAFPPQHIEKKELVAFANFTQWEDWYEQLDPPKNKEQKTKKTPVKPQKAKLSYKEQYALDHMQENIETLENKMIELEKQSIAQENISNPEKLLKITQVMSTLKQEIDNLYQHWQELELKQSE
ncbi:MAG: ABC-F family ATP-binding cassette domain-containing protein [Bdellovibrionota bacterium]